MFSTDYFEPWKTFQTPIVRQLAFAIASPNLLQHLPIDAPLDRQIVLHSDQQWQRYFQAYQSRLSQLDKDPTPLNEFLAKIKSTRLGLRFEALLWFWLADPANQFFELLGHGIQTHHRGKTLGEMDFLVRCIETKTIEHWEVCLKYYLAEYDLSLPTWIGLNPDDTFEHKLKHLINKQFQFDSALDQQIQSRKIIFKGQLYLPTQHTDIPSWINQNRRIGNWLETPPFGQHYRRLARTEWLCPAIEQPVQTTTIWWTNGLYYQPDNECFTMLKLKQQSYIYRN